MAIYSKLSIEILKWQNLKNHENFKSVLATWNFSHWVIFIIDFEYELRIDKNYEILPMSVIPATFCTFAKTYPITLKLPKYKTRHIKQK